MCRTVAILEHHSLILPKTRPYILPEEEVQDIDTMSDWEIAEAKFKVLHKGE
jgi:N-acylneuraminate cytidylyltransferase